MKIDKFNLTIGWLYPDLMSTYGDRGNIICLLKRCQWRMIAVTVKEIFLDTPAKEIDHCDFLFTGGAQDRQQKIVEEDLREGKGEVIRERIEAGVPGLYICAAYQLFGHRYQPAEGVDLEGLHIFDIETRHFGKDKPRCIGNIVAELPEEFFEAISTPDVPPSEESIRPPRRRDFLTSGVAGWIRQLAEKAMISPRWARYRTIVGFENHGGRTYLGKGVKALAKVLVGFGNNGEDRTDGLRYKNAIGNYFHGPILPKNPHLADWLIKKALEVKYKETVGLVPLDDTIEWQAHHAVLRKLGIIH